MSAKPNPPFELTKKLAIKLLDHLIDLALYLDTMNAGSDFKDHLPGLKGLKSKIQGAIGPCLNIEDFEKIDRFRGHLINHPRFKNKLEQFDRISIEYTKDNFSSKKVSLNETAHLDAIARFEPVDKLTSDVMNEIDPYVRSILPITSLMLLIVGRKETIDHMIIDILRSTANNLGLKEYDLEEICSVTTKVQKGLKYVTDMTAIRDCISHGHYEVSLQNDDYMITFSWQQVGGYDFKRTFTRLDFFKFFYDYWLFEKLQGVILIMNVFWYALKPHLMRPIK